jgi:hypothetical protein
MSDKGTHGQLKYLPVPTIWCLCWLDMLLAARCLIILRLEPQAALGQSVAPINKCSRSLSMIPKKSSETFTSATITNHNATDVHVLAMVSALGHSFHFYKTSLLATCVPLLILHIPAVSFHTVIATKCITCGIFKIILEVNYHRESEYSTRV